MLSDDVVSAAPSAPASLPRLRLYGYDSCPYTALVVLQADKMGLALERCDTKISADHRDDLLAARANLQTPVLRIGDDDVENDEWLPESRDIIRRLQALTGKAPPSTSNAAWAAMFAAVGLGAGSLLAGPPLGKPLAIAAVVALFVWRLLKRR